MMPAHLAAVRAETVVSVAINAIVPTAIIWALDVTPPTALTGPHGMMPGLLMASGLATLLMTIVVTLLVRGRVRSGTVPGLARTAPPRAVSALPALLPLRALAMALVAIAVVAPVAAGVASLLGLLPLTKVGFALFNIGLGTAVGLTMTPPVVVRALTDPA